MSDKNEDLAKFTEIIARGGVVICAPDVFRALGEASPEVASFGAVRIRVSNWVAPGTMYAVVADVALPPGEWKYTPLWPEMP